MLKTITIFDKLATVKDKYQFSALQTRCVDEIGVFNLLKANKIVTSKDKGIVGAFYNISKIRTLSVLKRRTSLAKKFSQIYCPYKTSRNMNGFEKRSIFPFNPSFLVLNSYILFCVRLWVLKLI